MLVAALMVSFAGTALAQQDISGTWAGTLAVAPDTNLEIHFVLTRGADGSYTAVVTSPDSGGIKDVAANTVSFSDNRLALTVDALSGSYDGALGNGAFEGEWRQEGTAFPLRLTPYVAPVLSQADKDALMGQWVGKLNAGITLTLVYRFEIDAAGAFVGFVDSPDQGATGLAITDIELVDGQLEFKIPQVRGEYSAKLEGDRMVGTWSQGQPLPLTMTKGEFTPTVAALGLSAEAMSTLAGAWHGQLGPLNVIFRFETAEGGEAVGFLDSPNQGATGVPITGATFEGSKLTFQVAAVRGEFIGDLSGNMLVGQWTQLGMTNPLTLTKD
jgi:hypothetical protein